MSHKARVGSVCLSYASALFSEHVPFIPGREPSQVLPRDLCPLGIAHWTQCEHITQSEPVRLSLYTTGSFDRVSQFQSMAESTTRTFLSCRPLHSLCRDVPLWTRVSYAPPCSQSPSTVELTKENLGGGSAVAAIIPQWSCVKCGDDRCRGVPCVPECPFLFHSQLFSSPGAAAGPA